MNKNGYRTYKKNDSLLFNSKNEWCLLSNMYPCKICYEGKIYYSSEQLFHYLIFQYNKEVQEEIMKCKGINNAFEVKKIANKQEDKIDEDYNEKKYIMLEIALEAKAKCCEDFRKCLIASYKENKNLVEYAPWGDTEFGTVYNRENNVYEGKNACGRIMMKVREKIYNNETGN